MATLLDLRDLIGDAERDYEFSNAQLARAAMRNNLALYATAADLRTQSYSKSGATPSQAWTAETKRLRNKAKIESTGGGFVGGRPRITTIDLGDIPVEMLLSAAVREDDNFTGDDFTQFVMGDTVTTPTFTGDMFVAFAVTYPPSAIELGFDQMAVFIQDGGFQDDTGQNFDIWRSRIALKDAWSNVEVEVRP